MEKWSQDILQYVVIQSLGSSLNDHEVFGNITFPWCFDTVESWQFNSLEV